jgi:hypothetical protein
MKYRYVRLIVALVGLMLGSSVVNAQSYRQLTADDFTGDIPPNSGFYVAHTSCNVFMNYNVRNSRSNYYLTFDIQLKLNRDRSWLNRKVANTPEAMVQVLRHEQGHYQIAYLMQQEMIRELNAYRYTGDYQRQANAIFKRIDDKYRQMNEDYDEDTQHMQNRKQQAAWVHFLDRELTRFSSLASNNYDGY